MDIEKLLNEIKAQVLLISKEKFKDYIAELQKDLNAFLKSSKEKLERWSVLLLEGSINQEEFEWLVKSQHSLLGLNALQTAGLSKIKLNNLKNNILKTIVETTAKAVIVGL